MTEFIILSRVDMLTLCDDKPVTVYIDKKPYVLCTDEYFEKQRNEPQGLDKNDKITIDEAATRFTEHLTSGYYRNRNGNPIVMDVRK